jgi:monothiol glutaredoxin
MNEETRQKIDSIIGSDRVVLFMKGNRRQPQCGFSATVVGILDELVPDYTTVDVLSQPAIREGIKAYSSWPTIPQLYVAGEFVGGCDIIRELYGSGELHAKLGVELPERVVPALQVSDAAAAFLREQSQRAGQPIHLRVDSQFDTRAYLGPAEPGEIEAAANGVSIHFDRVSAARADGLRIDYVATDHGHELAIENPNAPPAVHAIDAPELKALMDSGKPFRLYDVRTQEERDTASIPGAVLVDANVAAEIEKLPKDTLIVFHCHHGGRSAQAAEHFRKLGFRNLHNMTGGIDAWSRLVDASVPRY